MTSAAQTPVVGQVPDSTSIADRDRFHCRVEPVTYNGGIIGIFSPKRKKLESTIQKYNDEGYRLRHVLPSKSAAFDVVIQIVILVGTLFIWTIEPGETLVFEKRVE